MLERIAVFAIPSLAWMVCTAAVLPAQTNVIYLWPNGAPGSENWTQKEAEYPFRGQKEIRNVIKPSMTLYIPASSAATGTAVIVAPGGGFNHLAWENEGTMVGDWLQAHGVAAFVLKYRLVDSGTEEEFAQSQAAATAGRGGGAGAAAGGRAAGAAGGGRGGAGGRGGIPAMDNPVIAMSVVDSLKAIETVRTRAAEWHVDPAKIGIMGFSAGGYDAFMTGIEHTAANRPNFVAAIYACCLNAANIKVPDDAPPIFFLHAGNDGISASSPSLYLAWKAANKTAELHTYAAGGHGFGMAKHNSPTDGWIDRFADWLHYQKF